MALPPMSFDQRNVLSDHNIQNANSCYFFDRCVEKVLGGGLSKISPTAMVSHLDINGCGPLKC